MLIFLWISTFVTFVCLRPFLKEIRPNAIHLDGVGETVVMFFIHLVVLSLSIYHSIADVKNPAGIVFSIGVVCLCVYGSISGVLTKDFARAFLVNFTKEHLIPAVKAVYGAIWTVLFLPFKLLKVTTKIIDFIGRL